jgi:hemolysin activation/secretion protein
MTTVATTVGYAARIAAACLLASTARAIADPPPASPPAAAAPSAATAAKAAPRVNFPIEAYDVDGNTLLDQDTVESAVYPFLGPDRTRDDVASARDALQKAYQSKGYQSVIVEVPAQDARTGIIKLHVVEAPVGRLRVVDSRYFSLNRIKEQVPALQEGKVPNFTAAQQEVNDVNRLPERRVTPLIKPGKVPGTVDVDLKVSDTLPVHGSIELNNDHNQNTQPLRTTLTASYGDLFQLGHSLTATVLLAPQDPSQTQVYSGSYLAPIWGTPWSISLFGYSSNSTVATLGGTNVLGKGYAIGTSGILQLPPLGDMNQILSAGLDFKHFIQNLSLGETSQFAVVEYFPLIGSYTLQYSGEGATASASASLTLGLRGPGSSTAKFQNNRSFARADFVHLNLDLQDTQDLDGGFQVATRLSGQLANQPLLSSEQFSAGGLISVRGYLQSEALGDDGLLGSIEFRSPSLSPIFDSIDTSLVDEWRIYAFTDEAETWVLDALPGQQSQFKLMSVGVGTRLHALGHFLGEFDMGLPLRKGPATSAYSPYLEFSVKSEL